MARSFGIPVLLVLALVAGSLAGCANSAAMQEEQAAAGAATFDAISSTVRARAAEEARKAEEARIRAEEEARIAAEEARKALAQQRAAERQRYEQERINAWRERYPLDDYSGVLLIGDSIMQNAKAALEQALPGVEVNADSGRTLESGGLVFEGQASDKGVLDHVRNDDGSHTRYVIGTGNNDYRGMSVGDAEEIVERLGPDAQIYFVTEMVVGNRAGTDNTNAAIAQMVREHANVHAIDWHGLVAGREDHYLSDGCHPRASRLGDYAACIKEGLDVAYGTTYVSGVAGI